MATKMIITLEPEWDSALQEIKNETGAAKQFQVRQAIQNWIKLNQQIKKS